MTTKRRRLGRTGLMVSEISLGTVELGLDYGVPIHEEHRRPPEDQAASLLNRALDLGVNLIDTARAYGSSEEVIGRALQTRRQEYVLVTKVGAPPPDATASTVRDHVTNSVADSLRALRTDYVDVLMIHSATAEVIRRGDMIAAMLDAKQAGHTRFVGASTYGEEAPLLALEDGRYDCLQVAYSLVDRLMEERVFPLAQERDVGIVARSVLLRGVLTHRHRFLPPQLAELRAAIEKLDGLAGAASLPELAYRYVLAHPAVSTALVGTARLGELEQALAYAQFPPLSPDLIACIRQIVVYDRDQLNPSTWPEDMEAWQPQSPDGEGCETRRA